MCEIYDHPCHVCGIMINIHLGDYSTNASEILVFCYNHIPKENVVVWDSKKEDRPVRWKGRVTLSDIYTHNRVGIRSLTMNAFLHKDVNHPNAFHCDIVEERTLNEEFTNQVIPKKIKRC